MKTVNIGNRTELYIAEKSNTNYVLEKGDTVSVGSYRALYTNDDLHDVTYDIAGTVKGQTGLRIYTTEASQATTVDIAKTGKIIATQDGIDSNGDGHVVRNEGYIAGLGSDGVSAYGSQTVINNGEIFGQYSGIYMGSSTDDVSLIRNTGTISGDVFAIRTTAGADKIINSGTIEGDVLLGSGDDTFVFLKGKVDSEVDGSAGNDTYILHRPGVDVYENTGADQGHDLIKAAFSISLTTNVEDLTLFGKGDFTGIGNVSDNTLIGNAGHNTLMGGEGADVLKGGRGNDVLSGGTGADQFHFARGTGMDVVTDYAWASDKLYLDDMKGASDFADLVANHVTQNGNDLWITYGGDVIVLANSDVNDLNANYVLFS